MNANQIGPNRERDGCALNGWLMLIIWLSLLLLAIAVLVNTGKLYN